MNGCLGMWGEDMCSRVFLLRKSFYYNELCRNGYLVFTGQRFGHPKEIEGALNLGVFRLGRICMK